MYTANLMQSTEVHHFIKYYAIPKPYILLLSSTLRNCYDTFALQLNQSELFDLKLKFSLSSIVGLQIQPLQQSPSKHCQKKNRCEFHNY